MKKIKLLRSLRDLAAHEAKGLCSEDKAYYKQFVDAYEKKVVDDLINNAIRQANAGLVGPTIQAFVQNNKDIPIPFEVDGQLVNQIRFCEDYPTSIEASFEGEKWHYLNNDDKVRLFEALDNAGLLPFSE